MLLSIIIPCLNEEKTLEACLRTAHIGIKDFEGEAEIIVADNGSSDRSKEIARACGARVVDIEERGYGAAILGGLATAQGELVVIGDADQSYDFGDIPRFVKELQAGPYDLVIGNRFTGKILPGAMPFLNRYLGNPVLSMIGRILYGNVCGDFHCGLRGARRSSLQALRLTSPGMEFATEMIIKAATSKLRISEIPITLHPDGRDRAPHLRPWRDGMRHLLLMITYRFSKRTHQQ